MPTKIARLRSEARQACSFRGHKLGRFTAAKYSHRYFAECSECKMGVTVNPHPAPNDIEIGGEAVALHCPQRRK
jgi:hypothetical protein